MALHGWIPEERLDTMCTITSAGGSGAPVTLRFVIEDYVLHMQHHVDHLLSKERNYHLSFRHHHGSNLSRNDRIDDPCFRPKIAHFN